MKRISITLLFCLFLGLSSFHKIAKAPTELQSREKELFQVSTINALMLGILDGDYTYESLMKKGNYGIGTFQDADGEMIALDGNFYQIDYDGKISLVRPSQVTPFAQVVFFKPTAKFPLKDQKSMQATTQSILPEFINKNIPHAVFLKGKFSQMKVRSIAAQQKPYPSFLEVTQQQRVFKKNEVEGMAFGFWFPEYLDGIGVGGMHLHFLSEDHQFGGHILDFSASDISVSIQPLFEYQIHLPDVQSFAEVDLDQDLHTEIDQAEGNVP